MELFFSFCDTSECFINRFIWDRSCEKRTTSNVILLKFQWFFIEKQLWFDVVLDTFSRNSCPVTFDKLHFVVIVFHPFCFKSHLFLKSLLKILQIKFILKRCHKIRFKGSAAKVSNIVAIFAANQSLKPILYHSTSCLLEKMLSSDEIFRNWNQYFCNTRWQFMILYVWLSPVQFECEYIWLWF